MRRIVQRDLECGVACLAMLANVSYTTARKVLFGDAESHGTEALEMQKALLKTLLQNPFFRESKRNRMQYEYESEREPRSILQVPPYIGHNILTGSSPISR
jgi:hypothetical protein